jgi:hypothetical protein
MAKLIICIFATLTICFIARALVPSLDTLTDLVKGLLCLAVLAGCWKMIT